MDIPGFRRDLHLKPIVPIDSESLYAFGDLIRRTEQLILAQFGRGLVSGTVHTCLGQELCQMAVVRAMADPSDVVLSGHRNHGHFLTYSGDVLGLVAEVMGRATGVCGGRGGSQHLRYRRFHSHGVLGGLSGVGTGMALACKRRGERALVAIIVGDGALGEGLLYESMNLASIWDLPILFVVENNGIAQTTPTATTTAGSMRGRAEAFALTCWDVDDTDPRLFERAEQIVAEVRASERPGFLVIHTRRLGPHSKGDDSRTAAELEALWQRDALAGLGRQLSETVRASIDARNAAFVADVEAAASAAPMASDASRHVFAVPAAPIAMIGDEPQPAGQTVRSALNSTLRDLLATSESTMLLGQDLHDPYGGAFKVTAGLSTAFPGRVLSTPISEAAVAGCGIGLALAGFHPIVEVMFADFLTLCMDQIYNHAVKVSGLFADLRVPLVIRSPSGGGRGYGPTHSQSPENVFASVPGLTVVFGSHRHDNGRLLRHAVRQWPYPVLFMEHKLLYAREQDPGAYRAMPASHDDAAAHLFPTLVCGSAAPDVTIVTYGGMLPQVESAVRRLEDEEELAVEVVVPALLAPLPHVTLAGWLSARPRVVVVEESHGACGVGAEILACLLEAGYAGRAVRIATPPVPIYSARSLERQLIPDADRVVHDILRLF